MTQQELEIAVAEVTGEDLSDITSRGFSLARHSLEDEAFDCVAHEPSVQGFSHWHKVVGRTSSTNQGGQQPRWSSKRIFLV